MKTSIKKFFAVVVSLCLMFTVSVPAQAAEVTEDFNAEQFAETELNTWAEENGLDVTFENFHITPTRDNLTDAEIEASVRSYVEMMKCAMSDMSVDIISQPTTRATGTYKAKVESLIPAIGWGHINQDFTADVSSSKISSITLLGESYDTGFTIGTWDPNYSWSDISSNKLYCQIHMKGTINYLWEALNITQDCTFLDTFKASGSTLVDADASDWPD